jgi:hypothetical protein
MCFGLHAQYPLFLSDFNENCNLSTVFRKKIKISNLMKISPVGAELHHADRRMDVQTWAKLIVTFRSFANAPINIHISYVTEVKYNYYE